MRIVEPADFSRGEARRRWAELIRLVYEVDPMVCPRCGGEMRVIALIREPVVIDKILRHLREKGRDAQAGPWSMGPRRGGGGRQGGVRAKDGAGEQLGRSGQSTFGRDRRRRQLGDGGDPGPGRRPAGGGLCGPLAIDGCRSWRAMHLRAAGGGLTVSEPLAQGL